MIVTYRKHEIHVTPDTSRSGESAWTTIDGQRVYFWRGLDECKRYLRERAQGRAYGPRVASWSMRWQGSYSGSLSRTREGLISDLVYFKEHDHGGTPIVTRTEHCAYPGCDGDGTVVAFVRGCRTERPCPHHDASEETIEGSWDLVGGPPDSPLVAMASEGPTLPYGPGEGLDRGLGSGLGYAWDACDLTSDL